MTNHEMNKEKDITMIAVYVNMIKKNKLLPDGFLFCQKKMQDCYTEFLV